MAQSRTPRPKNRATEYEDVRPAGDGRPPRPASEPPGAAGSVRNSKTQTDPGTGEPNPAGPAVRT